MRHVQCESRRDPSFGATCATWVENESDFRLGRDLPFRWTLRCPRLKIGFEAKSVHDEKVRMRNDVWSQHHGAGRGMTCKTWFRDIPPSPQGRIAVLVTK